MAKGKSKYVSFAAQREQCRLNKFTYTERCGCGIVSLMCNYPFDDPKHKKGMCRASTCTDMRKTLAGDVDEILNEAAPVKDEVPTCNELDNNTLADSGSGTAHNGEPGDDLTDKVMDEAGEANAQEEDPKGAVRAE